MPFGNRELIGIIREIVPLNDAEYPDKLKDIHAVLPQQTGMNTELLKLTAWASDYYTHPIGDTTLAALPPYLRQHDEVSTNKHWAHTTEGLGLAAEALRRSPKQQEFHQYLLENRSCSDDTATTKGFSTSAIKSLKDKGLIKRAKPETPPRGQSTSEQVLKQSPLSLNAEQQSAVDAVRFHQFACYLLHGITGSGKTEVYLHLVARTLQAGKQALILVPEIGLSPQTVERFRKRFSVELAELHSGVSDAQRAKNWLAARNGEAQIVIGTRLAAFSALREPGLIIVDEEHDNSYKQQDGIRYSARDLSIVRAKFNQIPVVLGSATPSLESLKNALEGQYKHLVLRQRATGVIPPSLNCINLCDQALQAGLSETAINSIRQCVQNGDQALIFLNRRGYAPMQLCHSCGWVAECPNCSANMTLHQQPPRLHCHHCDRQTARHSHCPRCNSLDIGGRGIGTEQLETTLQQLFTDVPIVRVDRDSTRSKSALKTTFEKIHSGEPAILVGTQMIAKGHHFPKLKLVLIADADQGFLNPDFRAMEKMGQLLMQVAGRAGREQDQGQVLIQSHQPEHPLLQLLLTKGYTAFARELLRDRAQNRLSPYWFTATFRAESKRAENAIQLLDIIKNSYHNHFPPSNRVYLLGPLPAAIERVQDRFRFQLQISGQHRMELKTIIKHLVEHIEQHALSKRVRWSIDIDPIEG